MTASETGVDSTELSLKEVVIADRWRLIEIGLFVTGAAMVVGFDVRIPQWARLFGIVTAIAAIIAYAPAARLVAWLYRPDLTYLVALDATDADFAVWALPPTVWREIEIESELFPLQASVPAWECQEYNPETNTATGTWRGSASDMELIEERGRITEIRGVLEDMAKEGLGYRVMQTGMVRSSVRSVVLSFVESFERDAVYDGDEIRRSIDRTLSDWTYEDETTPSPGVTPGDDGSLAEANLEPDQPEADSKPTQEADD